jgi:sorbitol-specific phosphotransferase system component IIBC
VVLSRFILGAQAIVIDYARCSAGFFERLFFFGSLDIVAKTVSLIPLFASASFFAGLQVWDGFVFLDAGHHKCLSVNTCSNPNIDRYYVHLETKKEKYEQKCSNTLPTIYVRCHSAWRSQYCPKTRIPTIHSSSRRSNLSRRG